MKYRKYGIVSLTSQKEYKNVKNVKWNELMSYLQGDINVLYCLGGKSKNVIF